MKMRELKKLIYAGEKINVECKKASGGIPDSVYQTYSSFANTNGGIIVLGVEEDKSKTDSRQRYNIRGIDNPDKLRVDFWNTINSQKVSANILTDENVYTVEDSGKSVLVIEVPRADFTARPVYRGDNPFKGTYKRNHEGDYHAKEYEVRAMIRDQSAEGCDSTILEGYIMSDIDGDTLRRYRTMFNNSNPDHVWRELPDKEFLEMLGGYRRDRKESVEGLTVAGLLMFGTGLAIRDEFDNIFMDYRDMTFTDGDTRWIDRITYDGTWENNLFNFFRKVAPKLSDNLGKPFVLNKMKRIDDTPVQKAIREAFVNMIIHADYRMDAGVLKVIKNADGFSFSNPGNLKLPKEQIYKGGDSKTRNPHMQTMLRMIGFGDNAGSGFPDILKTWNDNGWETPELTEDTVLNQVTLVLKYKTVGNGSTVVLDGGKSIESRGKKNNEQSLSKLKKNERRMSEDVENERSLSEKMSEVLSKEAYRKVETLISYLEKNKSITPKVAQKLTEKSAPTTRRYLKMLVDTGYVKAEGNTNNIRYVI